MKKYTTEYLKIRTDIDETVDKLEEQHRNHMKCKAGCDMCCMDYSIFPVEFYSIREQLTNSNFKATKVDVKTDDDCVFLNNNRCNIYSERPIICRTHGLPLLFMNDNNWELSACELNFTEFNIEEFDENNTFPQDRFNSQLFMLNRKFISEFSETKYSEFDLLPVKELLNYFK